MHAYVIVLMWYNQIYLIGFYSSSLAFWNFVRFFLAFLALVWRYITVNSNFTRLKIFFACTRSTDLSMQQDRACNCFHYTLIIPFTLARYLRVIFLDNWTVACFLILPKPFFPHRHFWFIKWKNCTGVTNNINHGCLFLKCNSESWQCDSEPVWTILRP